MFLMFVGNTRMGRNQKVIGNGFRTLNIPCGLENWPEMAQAEVEGASECLLSNWDRTSSNTRSGWPWLDPCSEQQHVRKRSVGSCYKPHKVLLGSLGRNSTLGRSRALSAACGTRLREGARTEPTIYKKLCKFFSLGKRKGVQQNTTAVSKGSGGDCSRAHKGKKEK